MSFFFSLDPDDPLNLNTFTGNGETIVRTAIGHDDETGCVYSILVGMAPYPGHDDDTFELIFNITEANIHGDDTYCWWDGLDTKHRLSDPEHRRLTLLALFACVQRTIDVCRPRIVHMCTHTDGLPDKALRKFHRIAAIFRDNGYMAKAADPYHGRYIWMMERLSALPV